MRPTGELPPGCDLPLDERTEEELGDYLRWLGQNRTPWYIPDLTDVVDRVVEALRFMRDAPITAEESTSSSPYPTASETDPAECDPYKPRFIRTLGTLEGLDLTDLEHRARANLINVRRERHPELTLEEVADAVDALFRSPDFCRYFIEWQADVDRDSSKNPEIT